MILKYLDEAGVPVNLDKFPNDITSNFNHGIKPGSLIHELEITLKNAGWIKTPGYAHGPFFITNEGKQAIYLRSLAEERSKISMNIKLNKQFENLLIYLSNEEKRNGYFDFDEICQELNIEEKDRLSVFSHLYRSDYVTGPTSARTKQIRITAIGLEKVEEIEDEYFNKYGKPMNSNKEGTALIDETCERLFQMHKEAAYALEWTKETFYKRRGDLNNAKVKMIEEGILKEERDLQETKLKSEFWHLDSYEKAATAVKNKNDSLRSMVNTTNIHGSHNNVAVGSNITQNINIVALSKDDENKLKSYGVDQEEIDQLNMIISAGSKNKENFTSKLMKWLTSVSAALAARGIYEHLPYIVAFVQSLGNQHL